ncbi:uncharacterized protein LOC106655983 [Trichogramma pretiosum]|uniref:uncharacterized protein LOC106655983 n=1 Tax=Trichogramma pretiosum TaxID=7493 RepID=UPI0006C96754|nr:uncharacterized protein LOC106655983 [Trichogramma pretiosum]
MSQKRESKICFESERSSSVRVERDIVGDVYVGLTSTARRVRSYVARVKSASSGTNRSECASENQWIQWPSKPQGQPRVDLDQEKISTSCGRLRSRKTDPPAQRTQVTDEVRRGENKGYNRHFQK